MSSSLRIFSYLPNPRIWKATIAARLCGVELEVRGAAPSELPDWLWDFDAHLLSPAEQEAQEASRRVGKVGFKGGRLFKTDAFLQAHPFGTVPAAFSPDGRTGIFESNSIMRAVARLGQSGPSPGISLYGRDAYEASRIDSFLDASLVFARDGQIYLLALREGSLSADIHAQARQAFATYASGIDRAAAGGRGNLVGDSIGIADICFFAELTLFSSERLHKPALAKLGLEPVTTHWATEYPHAMNLYTQLSRHPAFFAEAGEYLEKLAAGGRA
jgi:elongation factor 1-gamma